jgi:hypothetical protein
LVGYATNYEYSLKNSSNFEVEWQSLVDGDNQLLNVTLNKIGIYNLTVNVSNSITGSSLELYIVFQVVPTIKNYQLLPLDFDFYIAQAVPYYVPINTNFIINAYWTSVDTLSMVYFRLYNVIDGTIMSNQSKACN